MWFATFPPSRLRMVSSASRGLSSTSSISICSNCSIDAPPGKGEVEGGPRIRVSFGPYPPAVLRDNAMHQREAYAGAWKIRGVVQALEYAEKLGVIARIEAGAVVAHEIDVLVLVRNRAHFDDRLVLLRREFYCVRDEVHPHLGEQA